MRSSAFLLVLLFHFGALAQEPPAVIDGDTVRIGSTTYRLMGFDTPETVYAKCEFERSLGKDAAAYLTGLLATRPWQIEDTGRLDKYRRNLARLLIDGQDVAVIMIGTGLARAYDGRGRRQGWC